MVPNDRVKMSPMWKYSEAIGTVLQITRDGYTVVRWDGINGDWYYTAEQASKIEVLNKTS